MLLTELNETEFLTDEVIEKWSHLAEEKYQKIAGKRADLSAKLRLTIEEILLRFRCFCIRNVK